jgi:signal transduction histidine kinase
MSWHGQGQTWQHPEGEHGPPPWAQGWHDRQRFYILRFVRAVVVIALLFAGGMAVLGFLFSRFYASDEHTFHVWWGGCGLALVLPLAALAWGMHKVRRVAAPVTDLLAGIDAVSSGNLSVRVPERGKGEFARLARSFNHMTAELERTDQQRRNLTADVAHELRTPLHIIQGNLEGVLDGVYAPTAEHIEATLEETRLLARLVDDLRTLSLAESGELPLVREPVDVQDLLSDVATSFSAQAESAGIDLRVTSNGSTRLTVSGDAGRLDQVLSNLVTNAIRHTPSGGSITLGASELEGRVRITVADTGEGIAPEELPFIFDRFWRGDRARTHSGGSSGLGLAIASQLVRAHGGETTVTSEVGKGTTFTIELPAMDSQGHRYLEKV